MRVKAGLQVFLAVAACAAAASCASESYRYIPATHKATTSKEAIYDEPPDAPTGSVRVQYVGIGELQPQKNGPKVKALHLKLIASNHAVTGNWALNANDFFVAFPDGTRSPALAAYPGSLFIAPGGLLAMDLYFPLPEKLESAKEIPAFDFHWKGLAINRQINETTAFDRIQIPRYYAYGEPYWDSFYGYGPYGPAYDVSLGYGWGHPW